MTPPRLPLTVISGYLGAGKTTLINRMLRAASGMRIMVMVNDFGAINIDADLLLSKDDDTITLTNGCVCCAMGHDLIHALGKALDRRPRPDALVIEASGVAEPGAIAGAARAEPELAYGGVVTLIDALNIEACLDDRLIGPQIEAQIRAADLLLISKADATAELTKRLAALSDAPQMPASAPDALFDLMLDAPRAPQASSAAHDFYAAWSYKGERRLTRAALMNKLRAPPEGAYRIKGFVLGEAGAAWEAQRVGGAVDIRPARRAVKQTALVALGPRPAFSADKAQEWWNA